MSTLATMRSYWATEKLAVSQSLDLASHKNSSLKDFLLVSYNVSMVTI